MAYIGIHEHSRRYLLLEPRGAVDPVAQLQAQIADLSAAIEALQAENDKLQRSTKRQTAPFSKVTRVNKPKFPGRKPGSDTFSFRQAPQPGEIIEPPVAVPVTLAAYPGCGGKLQRRRWLGLYHRPAPNAPPQGDPVPSVGQPLHWVRPTNSRSASCPVESGAFSWP
jgi:hypothetical protein